MQGLAVVGVVAKLDFHRLVLDQIQRCHHSLGHIQRQLVVQHIRQLQGIDTCAAELTCQIGFAVIGHIKEKAHSTQSMTRSQHAADILSAEGEDFAVFQLPVDHRHRNSGKRTHSAEGLFTHGFGIDSAQRYLCAVQIPELVGCAEMIGVGVGENDPAHIGRVKAQADNAGKQKMLCLGVTCIQKDQTFVGADQMYAHQLIAHIVKVIGHLERLDVLNGGLCEESCVILVVFGGVLLFPFIIPLHSVASFRFFCYCTF